MFIFIATYLEQYINTADIEQNIDTKPTVCRSDHTQFIQLEL